MNKPNLKGVNKDILLYIEYLEEECNKNKNDGAKRLLSELSGISGDFANDISNIRNGDGNCKFITEDKNDMIMERVLKLVDKMDKFKLLAQLSSPDEEVKEVKKSIRRPEDLAFNVNKDRS
jgi:hypothetical protein